MIFIIPLTRFLAGTSIGPTAANYPLIFAAMPFIARMVEQSLEEVDRGVIEAARTIWDGRADKVLAHATSGHALQQNLIAVMEAK